MSQYQLIGILFSTVLATTFTATFQKKQEWSTQSQAKWFIPTSLVTPDQLRILENCPNSQKSQEKPELQTLCGQQNILHF